MTEAFVDIWQGSLSANSRRLAELQAVLSVDELCKAQAMLREQTRMRFIVARGLLRTTLSAYLSCDPLELQFVLSEHGKPSLAHHHLAFNLSHSHDALLLAVSNMDTVGVDVELIKPRKGMHDIARRCFSVREFSHWQQLPPVEQVAQFFRLWTIKEAFVKAVGRGIALGLERCEVDMDNHLGFTAVPEEYAPASAWHVREVISGGYAAALVATHCDYRLQRLEF